jgi:hypothetical protein
MIGPGLIQLCISSPVRLRVRNKYFSDMLQFICCPCEAWVSGSSSDSKSVKNESNLNCDSLLALSGQALRKKDKTSLSSPKLLTIQARGRSNERRAHNWTSCAATSVTRHTLTTAPVLRRHRQPAQMISVEPRDVPADGKAFCLESLLEVKPPFVSASSV